MKTLIETRPNIMLVDPYTKQVIEDVRPHVVLQTPFIDARIANRDLRVLNGELTDAATDEEFAKYWDESGGDQELAVASFLSSFTEKPAPKPARGKAKAE